MNITITLEPDMSIEPGHQVILLPLTSEGVALSKLLLDRAEWSRLEFSEGGSIRIPHSEDVDRKIVQLIDELAHVRFSAPNMVQMTLAEVKE